MLILVQVVALHLLLHFRGPGLHPIAILHTLLEVGPVLLGLCLSGIAARTAYAFLRGHGGRYLKTLRDPIWWLFTVRLVLSTALVIHVYGWLKVMLQLVHPTVYDTQLWQVDRWLFFGHSPNVLLLYAFGQPKVLELIDAGYGRLFLWTLLGSLPFFFSFASDRLRLAWASGASTVWLGGAWLYALLPTLGPCYVFPEIWQPFAEHLPVAIGSQQVLLDNYRLVAKIPQGIFSPELNVMAGIAAMPSLHVAFQAFIALWARKLSRWLGIVLWISVLLMVIGSVVTGWHYLADAIAGLLLAGLGYHFGLGLLRLHRWHAQGPL